MEKNATVTINVKIETEKAVSQAEELISLLEAASLLANKLATSLADLEINIEV